MVGVVLVCGLGIASAADAGSCSEFTAPVWSYTPPEGTDAIFTGTADPDGNLYWIEFQKPLETQQLVSASRDGQLRYRSDFERSSKDRHLMTLGAVWADGRVLVATEENHVRAFDAESGELVWDTAVDGGTSYYGQLTDTGAGVIVASYGAGLTGIDLATGGKLWTHAGETSVSTVSGDVFLGERDADRQIFLTKLGSDGNELWSEQVRGVPVAIINGELPAISGASEITIRKEWWEIPSRDNVLAGNEFGSLLLAPSYGAVELQTFSTEDGGLIGRQRVSDGEPRRVNATSLLTDDHVLLVSQETTPCPCLCHPRTFQRSSVSAWSADDQQLFSCELPDVGEAGIEGASLYQGSLVIARRQYLSTSCTSQVQRLIIEGYDVPGEELAQSGWVVPAGNPAQSRRPLQ